MSGFSTLVNPFTAVVLLLFTICHDTTAQIAHYGALYPLETSHPSFWTTVGPLSSYDSSPISWNASLGSIDAHSPVGEPLPSSSSLTPANTSPEFSSRPTFAQASSSLLLAEGASSSLGLMPLPYSTDATATKPFSSGSWAFSDANDTTLAISRGTKTDAGAFGGNTGGNGAGYSSSSIGASASSASRQIVINPNDSLVLSLPPFSSSIASRIYATLTEDSSPQKEVLSTTQLNLPSLLSHLLKYDTGVPDNTTSTLHPPFSAYESSSLSATALLGVGPNNVHLTAGKKNFSLVVVTHTAYTIKYITTKIYHTKSINGVPVNVTDILTVPITTESLSAFAVESDSAVRVDAGGPNETSTQAAASSLIDADRLSYGTTSSFVVIPTSFCLAFRFGGASLVTALLSSQSPDARAGETYAPLYIPEMLGNAYGGGYNVQPFIWVISSATSGQDSLAAPSPYTLGALTDPSYGNSSATGNACLSGSSTIILFPGLTYSVNVQAPPILVPTLIVTSWQTQQSSARPVASSVQATSATATGKPATGDLPASPSFIGLGLKTSLMPLIGLISVFVAILLL